VQTITFTGGLGRLPSIFTTIPPARRFRASPIFIFDNATRTRACSRRARASTTASAGIRRVGDYLFVHGDQLPRSTDITSAPRADHVRGGGHGRDDPALPLRAGPFTNFARIILVPEHAVSFYHGLTFGRTGRQ